MTMKLTNKPAFNGFDFYVSGNSVFTPGLDMGTKGVAVAWASGDFLICRTAGRRGSTALGDRATNTATEYTLVNTATRMQLATAQPGRNWAACIREMKALAATR